MSKLLKLSFVLLSTVALIAAENPWYGTWKLDPAKSKLASYPKSVRELTVTIRDIGNQRLEVTLNGTAVDGTPISRRSTGAVDGGPTTYLEGGPPAGVSENTTVINDKVRDSTMTRDGKPLSTMHVVLSEDGKSMSTRSKGVTFDGKPLDVTGFYEKQYTEPEGPSYRSRGRIPGLITSGKLHH